MNTNEILTAASDFKERCIYSKAAELFKEVWDNNRGLLNDWDIWNYAYSLRKMNKNEETYEVCKFGYKRNPRFEPIVSLMSWCLFDLYIRFEIRNLNYKEDKLLKAANFIVSKTQQRKFSAYEPTVFKVVDYLCSKDNVDYKAIDEWLDKLNPNQLDEEPFKITDHNGNIQELESKRERWYSEKTKCLEKLEQYEHCIKLSRKALGSLKRLHRNNDILFRRRIAICIGNLGNIKKAISLLEELLKYKRLWYIQGDIAYFYYNLNDFQKSYEYIIEALLNFEEIDKKIELIVLLAKILKQSNKADQATRHLLLVKKIKEKNHWKQNNEFLIMLEEFQVKDTKSSFDSILGELRKGWLESKISTLPKGSGVIKNMSPDSTSGVIRGNDGYDYFFIVNSIKGNRKDIALNIKVKYHIQASFDAGKNEEKKAAINIEVVD